MPRPTDTGGRFVRWTPARSPATTGQLLIAPALYREIGSPQRVSLERAGNRTTIRPAPAKPPSGMTVYTVVIPGGPRGGMPRISVGRVIALRRGLVDGQVDATVEDNAIVVNANDPSP